MLISAPTYQQLFQPLTVLHGVGPTYGKRLQGLVGQQVVDLLYHLPSSLQERQYIKSFQGVMPGALVTVEAVVLSHTPKKNRRPYTVLCQVGEDLLHLVFFNAFPQHLVRLLPLESRRLISGKLMHQGNGYQIAHPDFIGYPKDRPSWSGPQPVYPLTYGVTQTMIRTLITQALSHLPTLPEWIPDDLRLKSGWPTWQEAMAQAHQPQREADLSPLSRARSRLAFDELLADQLILQQSRQQAMDQAIPLTLSPQDFERVCAILPFDLTNAQRHALDEIFTDLSSNKPMCRLLQGDVGSGKTVVAFLTCFAAMANGYQAALMAPTEILARQHAETLTPWMTQLGLKLALLTGKDTARYREQVRADLASGALHLAIGTHALIQDSVSFQNLGVIVIDEQHRFGVEQRLKLRHKGQGLHQLTMTATPIPRTLVLSSYGDIACSYLREKPAGRQPIETRLVSLDRLPEVVHALERAIAQGRKIYWICPLIEESENSDLAAAQARYDDLSQICPNDVGLIHGRISARDRDLTLKKFIQGEIHVVVATTVIEVGVHVADASIMIIEHAERFGLAQLHQLRGRIGRGTTQSTCMLLYQGPLSDVAQERLKTMRDQTDGFLIAEADWRLRGGGDILGLRQSGLPSYRLADLHIHQHLLPLAAEEAKRLLRQDPTLTQTLAGQAAHLLLRLLRRDEDQHLLAA